MSLPNGRRIREKFDNDTTLRTVLDHVTTSIGTSTSGMVVVQPFPHVVYSDIDMLKTLLELGLTPSGSLALNTAQPAANTNGTS